MKFAKYFSKRMPGRNKLTKLLETDFLMDMAHKVVMRYVQRRAIPEKESQDVEMAMVEKFLKQKQRIVQAFEGKSAPETYGIAILNRMCCEVIRQEQKHWYHLDADEVLGKLEQAEPSFTSISPMMFQFEINRLKQVMETAIRHPEKLRALLAVYFELQHADRWLADYAGSQAKAATALLTEHSSSSKSVRYELLGRIISLVEQRKMKADAARMYLYKEMDRLIELLNKNEQSNHSRETLRLLFELLDQDDWHLPAKSRKINKEVVTILLCLLWII